MNPLIVIVAIIALGAFAAMCISIIGFLGKAKSFLDTTSLSLQMMQRTMDDISHKIEPTIELTNSTLKKTTNTLERLDTQLDILNSSVHNVNDMVNRVTTLQKKVQDKVEEPIMKTASFIAGISKAIQAVTNALRP